MALTWSAVLGWRMRRQLLDPVGTGSVADVVERLGAVPAWPDPAMELAIGARRTDGHAGDAARALATDQVVKVFAFRGATHLMTPQDAGAYLAVRASSRMWELPSWVSFYRLTPGGLAPVPGVRAERAGGRAPHPLGADRRVRPQQPLPPPAPHRRGGQRDVAQAPDAGKATWAWGRLGTVR